MEWRRELLARRRVHHKARVLMQDNRIGRVDDLADFHSQARLVLFRHVERSRERIFDDSKRSSFQQVGIFGKLWVRV